VALQCTAGGPSSARASPHPSCCAQVEQLQAESWETRERHEGEVQQLQQRLAATQRQLEAVVGELQQRAKEVQNLTTSNRRLLRQKVAAMSGDTTGALDSSALSPAMTLQVGHITGARPCRLAVFVSLVINCMVRALVH
jgi:septal ring factor EnvC (AmiA/AmiB activator)